MNCKIVGYEYKTLEVTLSPGESFYAERGSIVWVDEALQRDAEMNGGSSGNSTLGKIVGGVLKSALSGESVLIVHFYNPTDTEKRILLSGTLPSLIPVRLQGDNLICRRGRYVASTQKVDLSLNLNMEGLLGGVGVFQKVEGNATVFLDSIGAPVEKVLSANESIEVDEDHIVALQGFHSWQIEAGWSLGNVLRGEGWSLMRLVGPGRVLLSPVKMIKPSK